MTTRVEACTEIEYLTGTQTVTVIMEVAIAAENVIHTFHSQSLHAMNITKNFIYFVSG